MNLTRLFARPNRPKLYLASLAIPDIAAYTRLFGKKQSRNIALITTPWNNTPAAKSKPFIERVASQLTEAGFTVEQLDLADYTGRQTELQAKLALCGGVWITGGNTFYLNYHLHQSGFDALLPVLFAQGFVYGAESAGSVVAGKTLHGVEILDDPAEAPEVIWEGLALVDYGILPHWGKPKYAGRYQQAYEEMRLFTPVKTITDDEFIVVA